MESKIIDQLVNLLVFVLLLLKTEGGFVPITYVEDAASKGAAYHFYKGSGEGNKNWIVHMEAILSGCSAGGLTAILHCDRFKGLLPKGDTVKCLSYAGYFIYASALLICSLLICSLYLNFHCSLDRLMIPYVFGVVWCSLVPCKLVLSKGSSSTILK